MATASTYNIAYALYETTRDKQGRDLEQAYAQSIEFLSKKRLLSKSKEILEQLQKIIDEKERVIRVHIETSSKLNKTTEEEIEKQIKARYKAKDVVMEITENKEHIRGIKIKINDEVLDLTLAHQLHQLENHLIAH